MSDIGDLSGDVTLAVIAGPTASGKSALALELAGRAGGTIINADASQVYRDLQILSARPTAAEEALVPHRLFGVLDGAEDCSAARWAALATAEIAAVARQGRLPVLVGGTGLYLRTLLEGIAPVPAIDPAIRAAIRQRPAAAVRAELEAEDGAMAARLSPNDRQRNARALEVLRSSGRSLLWWQQQPRQGGLGARVRLCPWVVERPRAELVQRIDARIARMWRDGALAEAARLAGRNLPATMPVLRAIGVPPLLALLRREIGEAEALARWQLDTRRYAKRQETWFRTQMVSWPRANGAMELPYAGQ